MSVKDHGLEAIRKSAAQVTSGDNSEFKIKTFNVSGMLSESYDYVAVSYPLTTQEVYVFKSGGSGGTTVATVTINYTDATKANISDVAKT